MKDKSINYAYITRTCTRLVCANTRAILIARQTSKITIKSLFFNKKSEGGEEKVKHELNQFRYTTTTAAKRILKYKSSGKN